MFEIVAEPVSPPGSSHTASASATMMRMLRMCLARSGPTPDSLGQRLGLDALSRRRGRSRGRRVEGFGGEAVADPEVGVDVAPARRGALELLAQLAHEDVDRAVAVDHRIAPHALVDLLAREHLAGGVGQQLDELELAAREIDAGGADEGLELIRADLELARHDGADLHPRGLGAPAPARDGL